MAAFQHLPLDRSGMANSLRAHLEYEFETKMNRQIYWDDVALFCHPEDYRLGIREMKPGDVIEIDSIAELARTDESYKVFLAQSNRRAVSKKEDYQNEQETDSKQRNRKSDRLDDHTCAASYYCALCILFFCFPQRSNEVVSQIRFFLGDTFGTYYLAIGLGVFLFFHIYSIL